MGKGKKGKAKKKPAARPASARSRPKAEAGPLPRTDADAGPMPAPVSAVSDGEATPVVPARADLTPPPPPAPPMRVDPEPRTGSTDRRLFRRVPFFRKVQYRFESMEEFKSRFANDLSLGGMFIGTEEPEPVGSVIFLEFDLQDGSKILSGYGKVVRVNPRGVPDFDPGMGVEFLKFDDESLARIRQLVSERFRE